jgi:hypothetical protein
MLYIAAWHNSRIEKLDLETGELHFECGNGDRAYGGDGGPAANAIFDLPAGIEFDDDGTLYISDTANQIIRVVDDTGTIRTVAGTPPPGLLPNGQTDRRYGWEGDGADALAAKFNMGWGQRGYPGGRIVRDGRTLYIADSYNFVVRALDLDSGVISHVAGLGLIPGYEGDGGPPPRRSSASPPIWRWTARATCTSPTCSTTACARLTRLGPSARWQACAWSPAPTATAVRRWTPTCSTRSGSSWRATCCTSPTRRTR